MLLQCCNSFMAVQIKLIVVVVVVESRSRHLSLNSVIIRDWSKSTGVGRSISKCGGKKTHDPPLPFGTRLSDPPLNEG